LNREHDRNRAVGGGPSPFPASPGMGVGKGAFYAQGSTLSFLFRKIRLIFKSVFKKKRRTPQE